MSLGRTSTPVTPRGAHSGDGLPRSMINRRARAALSRAAAAAGAVAAVWLTGVLYGNDFSVPTSDVRRFRNVLAIFPHADDETVNCGGALRAWARNGATVTLLVLTNGERGNRRGEVDESLKRTRQAELQRAAGILGISCVIQQDFGDGELHRRLPELAEYLNAQIGTVRPDLVVTYDHAGLYGHFDHVACAEVVSEVLLTKWPDVTLWYVTLPSRVVTLLVKTRQLVTSPGTEARRTMPTWKVGITNHVFAKLRAWYAYRSQRQAIGRGLGQFFPVSFLISMMQFEYFADARAVTGAAGESTNSRITHRTGSGLHAPRQHL